MNDADDLDALIASLPTDADVDKLLDDLAPSEQALLASLAALPVPVLVDGMEQPALPFGNIPATNAATATKRQPEKAVNTGDGNGNGNRCHPAEPLPATRCHPVANPLPSSRRGGGGR